MGVLEGFHYIAIEGPIGVGKTGLARRLAKRLSARLILEPAESNPFLEKFYSDMPRYALATQLVFLVSRYQQQTEIERRYLFHPIAVSDYILAKDRIFAGLTLCDDELRLYDQLYEVISTRAARPHVVVLLQADVDTLMERIHGRAIKYEEALPRDYIERLVAAYDEHFRLYAASPLLVIDTSAVDYSKDGIDVDELIDEIGRTRSGRRVYVPGATE